MLKLVLKASTFGLDASTKASAPPLDCLDNNTLVKFVPDSLDMLAAAHRHCWPSPYTLAPELPTTVYNPPDSNPDCWAARVLSGWKLNYVFKTRGIANFGTRCSCGHSTWFTFWRSKKTEHSTSTLLPVGIKQVTADNIFDDIDQTKFLNDCSEKLSMLTKQRHLKYILQKLHPSIQWSSRMTLQSACICILIKRWNRLFDDIFEKLLLKIKHSFWLE